MHAMRSILLFVFLAGIARTASAMSWRPCDSSASDFTPSAVELTPDPPQTGADATFDISGKYEPDGALVSSPYRPCGPRWQPVRRWPRTLLHAQLRCHTRHPSCLGQ
jgi:hypothetical protein